MTAKGSRRIEPEMIVAISAVVVGLCALGVSFYQTLIMREQQRELSEQRKAEVWPNLEFGRSYWQGSFRLIVLNTGVGPARIRTVGMTYDDESYTNWDEMLERIAGRINYGQSQVSGRVLPAGDQIEALSLDGNLADTLGVHSHRLTFRFCYCSIYNDCWLYEQSLAGSASRVPLEACEATDADFKQ